MADMSDFVAQNIQAPNAIQQANQGVQSGMEWATKKAGLDIQQGQLQNQLQQTQTYKNEMTAKIGQQFTDNYAKYAAMDNKSPLKKAYLEQWADNAVQSGVMNEDKAELFKAGAFDPATQAELQKMTSALGNVSDPQVVKKLYSGSLQLFPQGPEALTGMADKIMTMQQMMAKMEVQNNYTTGRQATRISAQEMNKAVSDATKATSNDQNTLGSIKRLRDTAAAANNGTIIDNPQVLASLNTERAKVEMGANKLTEGSVERNRTDSVLQSVTALIQKMENAPKSAKIKAFSDQIVNESKVLQEQYMQDVDTHHEMLKGAYQDYPQATNAIDRQFSALRKNVSNSKNLGEWDGIDKYKIKPSKDSGKSASLSPEMTQKAARFKQLYDKIDDPVTKQKALERAKQELGQDALTKVGIQ